MSRKTFLGSPSAWVRPNVAEILISFCLYYLT
jgi:hypothetical protein